MKERTLADLCHHLLEKDLFSAEFGPGERLVIDQLKRKYAVANGPIREALGRLAQSGLIETESNKGFRVINLTESWVRDLIETYARIEVLALDLAIARGDDAWESRIVGSLYQLRLVEEKESTYEEWVPKNSRFHRSLVDGCGSAHLLEMRDKLYQKFSWTQCLSFSLNTEPLLAMHEKNKLLTEKTLERDSDGARLCLWEHLTGTTESIIKSLKESGYL